MNSLLRRALPLVAWPLVLCLLAFAVAAAQMWLARPAASPSHPQDQHLTAAIPSAD